MTVRSGVVTGPEDSEGLMTMRSSLRTVIGFSARNERRILSTTTSLPLVCAQVVLPAEHWQSRQAMQCTRDRRCTVWNSEPQLAQSSSRQFQYFLLVASASAVLQSSATSGRGPSTGVATNSVERSSEGLGTDNGIDDGIDVWYR
jgi:hypothetical protein